MPKTKNNTSGSNKNKRVNPEHTKKNTKGKARRRRKSDAAESFVVIAVLIVIIVVLSFVKNVKYDGDGKLRYRKGNWYVVENGKINENYNGVVKYHNDFWRVENGMIIKDAKGLIVVEDGATPAWYYFTKGKVDKSYKGIVSLDSGDWYVSDGMINYNMTGLYYVEKGDVTGWCYMIEGRINYDTITLAANKDDIYYVSNGTVDKSFNGIANDSEGAKWLVKDGKVQKDYSGEYDWYGLKYKVESGKIVE